MSRLLPSHLFGLPPRLHVRGYLPQAQRNNPERCPLALAIKGRMADPLHIVRKVEVLGNVIIITFADGWMARYPINDTISEAIRHYDATGEWSYDFVYVATGTTTPGHYRRAA